MLINNNVLLRFAADGSYNWMRSLAPLRQALKSAPRSCCRKRTIPAISREVYDQIARSSLFKDELRGLKTRFGTPLTIAVGSVRYSVS